MTDRSQTKFCKIKLEKGQIERFFCLNSYEKKKKILLPEIIFFCIFLRTKERFFK